MRGSGIIHLLWDRTILKIPSEITLPLKRDPKKPDIAKINFLKSLIEEEDYKDCQLYKMMVGQQRSDSPPPKSPEPIVLHDLVQDMLLAPLVNMPPRDICAEFYDSLAQIDIASERIQDFYNSEILLTTSQKPVSIFIDSIYQAISEEWKLRRKPRFTSSKLWAILQAQSLDSAWNHWKKPVPKLRNTDYGKFMEETALDVLMMTYPSSYSLHKSGTMLKIITYILANQHKPKN